MSVVENNKVTFAEPPADFDWAGIEDDKKTISAADREKMEKLERAIERNGSSKMLYTGVSGGGTRGGDGETAVGSSSSHYYAASNGNASGPLHSSHSFNGNSNLPNNNNADLTPYL